MSLRAQLLKFYREGVDDAKRKVARGHAALDERALLRLDERHRVEEARRELAHAPGDAVARVAGGATAPRAPLCAAEAATVAAAAAAMPTCHSHAWRRRYFLDRFVLPKSALELFEQGALNVRQVPGA